LRWLTLSLRATPNALGLTRGVSETVEAFWLKASQQSRSTPCEFSPDEQVDGIRRNPCNRKRMTGQTNAQ
jgi:hypothetical protein